MKRFIKSFALLLCFTLLVVPTGCGNDPKDTRVYFELSDKPKTVDAQTASTDSELMIVRNIYEGLLRKDNSGKLVNGVAESYSVDGLTYTFTLRKDAKWSNGDPVTAHDFVFGMRRAVRPSTKSPFVNRLFSIAGAQQINSGKLDETRLGVTAADDHTLTITLTAPDDNFLETLTNPLCMPCNEKFFNESVGKYGLKSEYVLSNGSYALTKWSVEDFGIRLYSNDDYNGSFVAKNGGVFLSCVKDSTPLSRLKENSVDAAFIDNESVVSAKADNFHIVSYENICWVMTISPQYNANVRRAFSMLIGSQVYAQSLGTGFRAADSLFPAIFNPAASVSGSGITPYDLQSGISLFTSEVLKMQDKKFPSATLTYYNREGIKPAITDIVGHWQQKLSAFINIEPYDSATKLQAQLSQPTLAMAVFPIYAANDSMKEYLLNFGYHYNGEDPSVAQNSLLKNHTLLPIAFENTNLVYSDSLSEVYTEPENGYIDFSYIVKHE